MKYTINAYLAVLIITLVGAGASMLIIRTAYTTSFNVLVQPDIPQELR